MNKAILLGNVGRTPDLKELPNGTQCAEFSLATNRKWTNKDGEKVEETEWHNVVAYGRQAEVIGKYVEKGSKLMVEGRIKTDQWEKDGEKRYKTRVILDQFEFAGGSSNGASKARARIERGMERSGSRYAGPFQPGTSTSTISPSSARRSSRGRASVGRIR